MTIERNTFKTAILGKN